VLVNQWAGANWVSAERIAKLVGGGRGLDAVLQVLALHPALPPGLDATLERVGEHRAMLRFSGPDALLDAQAPGWLGLLASGEPLPLEAIAQAVEPRARVRAEAAHSFAIEIDPDAEPAKPPQSVQLTRLSTAAAWRFREPMAAAAARLA
jgi:hypothetical protein